MMDSQQKRLQSDEEIMAEALDKRGALSLRVSFAVKDSRGVWRPLRRRDISLRQIPNQGRLWRLVDTVLNSLKEKSDVRD